MSDKSDKSYNHCYYAKNRAREKQRARVYYAKHKNEVCAKAKLKRTKSRGHLIVSKAWKDRNKQKVKEYNARYWKNHKNRISEKKRIRYHTDLKNRILLCLRSRVVAVVKGRKLHRTLAVVGCSVDFLIKRLESQWLPGMNWDTFGPNGWHIDHIKPCASFDMSNPEQQKECFHYTNLQPLWARDNWAKGAKTQ